jgi:hypothetical protein
VHQAVALYGDLILQRRRGEQCIGPITQYCPVCLADSRTAYLRSGWRFSFEVACWDDGCLLLDACWKCGASVNPLAQAIPSTAFLCAKCHARLADAPSVRMDEFIDLQHFICSSARRSSRMASSARWISSARRWLIIWARWPSPASAEPTRLASPIG